MPCALMLRIGGEHVLHDQRREAERRLVEQQQARPRHQRARDRDHLLLAARQLAGGAARASRLQHREQRERGVERRLRAAPSPPAGRLPSSRFSSTVMPVNRRRPSGHHRDAGFAEAMRRQARDVASFEDDPAGARARRMPASVLISVVLPAPFGPTTHSSSPAPQLERDAPQRRRRAVGDLQVAAPQAWAPASGAAGAGWPR